MDKNIAEKLTETAKETQTKVQTQEAQKAEIEKKTEIVVQSAPPQNSYLTSFENMTVADIKREEERKEKLKFEQEKEELISQQFSAETTIQEALAQKKSSSIQGQEKQEESQQTKVPKQEKTESVKQTTSSANVIEKPNYDLIEQNVKVVKIKKKKSEKSKKRTKAAGIALACALAGCAIVCVTNTVIIDQMNSEFIQIDENYNFNLATYLRNIYNLDTTKNSMEMIETYPEDLLEAGDLGQESNWFDRLCNFIGGIFGG